MKMKKTFLLLLTCIGLLTGFSACNDNGPVDLDLLFKTFYAKVNEQSSLYIYSGNGGYTVTVNNESVATAKVEGEIITITPVKKGTVTLTVKDSDERTASVTIYVIDPYMAFAVAGQSITANTSNSQTSSAISTELEKNPTIKKSLLYDFSKNTSKTFYVYKDNWFTSPESDGEYEFDTDSKSFTLTVNGEDHVFTLEANNQFATEFYDYFASPTYKPNTSNSDPIFTVKEDLTSKYKEQYPNITVNEVSVTSTVYLYRYKYEYNTYN